MADMQELFFQLVEKPTRETYTAAWDLLTASDAYNPYSNDLFEIMDLVEAEKLDEAVELVSLTIGNLLLSPSLHLVMSSLNRRRGNEDGAELEIAIAAACAEGILATGDGSKAAAYLVTRTSDEHDILAYLQKELESQALVHENDRHYDQLTTKDGAEFWFDITRPYSFLEQRGPTAEDLA